MEKRIYPKEISATDRISRISFLNAVSGLKGAGLIGTPGHRGTPDLAIFNSLLHLSGGDPIHGKSKQAFPIRSEYYPDISRPYSLTKTTTP